MKSRSAVLHAPKDLRIEEVEVPALKSSEILVKVHMSGICGSDVASYLGYSKEARFDIGPFIPGHEWCGEVVDVGKAVTSLKAGDKVVGESAIPCNSCEICKEGINNSYCPNWKHMGFEPQSWGGLGEYLVTEEQCCFKVPGEMSYLEGALVECCSVSYYAIYGRNGYVASTDDCVVFGGGPIGQFAALTCKAAGAKVIMVEPVEFRRELAKKVVHVDAAIDPSKEDIEAAVMRETGGKGASLIVECTGSDQAVAATMDIAKAHARIRYIGHSIGRKIPMEIGKAIWKGLNLQGSAGQPWFFPKTIKFLSRVKEHFDYSGIVTQKYAFDDIQKAFDTAAEQKEKAVKVMVAVIDD